jgi:hypothetical protein
MKIVSEAWGRIISSICVNSSGSGREKCWNCDGEVENGRK